MPNRLDTLALNSLRSSKRVKVVEFSPKLPVYNTAVNHTSQMPYKHNGNLLLRTSNGGLRHPVYITDAELDEQLSVYRRAYALF